MLGINRTFKHSVEVYFCAMNFCTWTQHMILIECISMVLSSRIGFLWLCIISWQISTSLFHVSVDIVASETEVYYSVERTFAYVLEQTLIGKCDTIHCIDNCKYTLTNDSLVIFYQGEDMTDAVSVSWYQFEL